MLSLSPILPLIFHPLTHLSLEILLTSLTIAYLPPSLPLRLAILPSLLICILLVLSTCLTIIPRISFSTIAAGLSVNILLRYISLTLIEEWTYEAQGPTKREIPRITATNTSIAASKPQQLQQPSTTSASAWTRLHWALCQTLWSRHSNTPHRTKNIPSFSSLTSVPPSRTAFLTQTFTSLLLSYILIDLNSQRPPCAARATRTQTLFAPATIPIFAQGLGNATIKGLSLRTFATLTYWTSTYLITRIGYDSVAFVAVLSGASEAADWPPAFGSMADAPTLRGFWGKSWHQMFRTTFSTLSSHLTHSLLFLPRDPTSPFLQLLSRYTKLVLTFLISGILHLAIDTAVGIRASESGSIRFFSTQILGIMIEDACIAAFKHFHPDHTEHNTPVCISCPQAAEAKPDIIIGSQPGPPKRSFPESHSHKYWRGWKILGYAWTLLFLTWSTPTWAWPWIRLGAKGRDVDKAIPFSALKAGREIWASEMVRGFVWGLIERRKGESIRNETALVGVVDVGWNATAGVVVGKGMEALGSLNEVVVALGKR